MSLTFRVWFISHSLLTVSELVMLGPCTVSAVSVDTICMAHCINTHIFTADEVHCTWKFLLLSVGYVEASCWSAQLEMYNLQASIFVLRTPISASMGFYFLINYWTHFGSFGQTWNNYSYFKSQTTQEHLPDNLHLPLVVWKGTLWRSGEKLHDFGRIIWPKLFFTYLKVFNEKNGAVNSSKRSIYRGK